MTYEKSLISFDYAIKYLLKDKGDYSIVEGFISALLKTKGYKDVKIIALLESESNKEDSKSKRSLADVIVEDEDHNKYIIEIERSVKDSFIHKSLFNTSRLIIDNLSQGEDYTEIVKVFHISLLYFPVGNNNGGNGNGGNRNSNEVTGNGSIYHGKTIIHEIESNEKLSVNIKNPHTGKIYDATNILPEYFFISVPSFNDRMEKEIDDWLYVMKHDELPKKIHSSYMEKVAQKLSILKMSESERTEYSYYLKKLYSDRDELAAATNRGIEQGMAKGIKQGIKQGIEQGQSQMIKIMLARGNSVETISSITGLNIHDIEKLKE